MAVGYNHGLWESKGWLRCGVSDGAYGEKNEVVVLAKQMGIAKRWSGGAGNSTLLNGKKNEVAI
jgi:hypothetical protein